MKDYWDALNRLSNGSPVRVPKGTPINKDTVALEAGRKRGSIKKSRFAFGDLIAAIESATPLQPVASPTPKDLLRKERERKQSYKELYHLALNRELMLLERLALLEKEIQRFKNVVPIRG